jgi:hypothetical protein
MQDYNGNPLEVGHTIKNIESGWKGQIISTEGTGADLMLACKGINWWTGELDDDDTQWHSPYDVVRVTRKADQSEAPNPLNFLSFTLAFFPAI